MLLKYRLPHQLEGENVIKIVRRDMMILLQKILLFAVLSILPLAFMMVMLSVFPGLQYGQTSYPILVLGTSAYYLFIWLLFFFSFIDYYLDAWIITDQRIIYIKQDGFFARAISEQRIELVQDVTSEIHGVFPTIFNYGDVHVQTAAETVKSIFHQVPDPENVRDVIIRLAEEKKRCKRDGGA